jgi:hypothetical protein
MISLGEQRRSDVRRFRARRCQRRGEICRPGKFKIKFKIIVFLIK